MLHQEHLINRLTSYTFKKLRQSDRPTKTPLIERPAHQYVTNPITALCGMVCELLPESLICKGGLSLCVYCSKKGTCMSFEQLNTSKISKNEKNVFYIWSVLESSIYGLCLSLPYMVCPWVFNIWSVLESSDMVCT